MCDNKKTLSARDFLFAPVEPRIYRDRADQLLKTMGDTRCACAATCPMHRIPGEQWSRPEHVVRPPEPLAPASHG